MLVVRESGSPLRRIEAITMKPSSSIKLVLALLALAGAGYLLVQFFRQNDGISEKAFFYDLSEQKLFAAPRGAVPPIRGINDAQEDAVRAVVISTNGNPRDRKGWTIAYLEKCTPELKKQFENAQATGSSPPMGRGAAQNQRLVRRLTDTQWFSLASDEGERIVSEWPSTGPGETAPVVCTP